MKGTLRENQGGLFSGNGYDQEVLLRHVEQHQLFNLRTSPEAYARLSDEKNITLLADLKVFTEHETLARRQLLQEAYVIDIQIEANTLLYMLRTGVAPVCARALAETLPPEELTSTSNFLYKQRRMSHMTLLREIDTLAAAIDVQFCSRPS